LRRTGTAWITVALTLFASPQLAAAAADPPDARGDYGVNLAITGEATRAESVFVSMLSHTRGDARALNNLGNIRLLRGEAGVALAFYDRALRADSIDAGIYLNRATAFMVIGDDARAHQSFQTGVKLAGSLEHAQALLGLPPEKVATDKAASKTAIDPEQLRAMLQKAATSVPKDSVHTTGKSSSANAASKQPSAWRSAGARGSDGSGAPQILYWKH
jgi:tetratricopeptide (TPR) repeat protein